MDKLSTYHLKLTRHNGRADPTAAECGFYTLRYRTRQ